MKSGTQSPERLGTLEPKNSRLLQTIRQKFTSGRPRKVSAEILGPMYAALSANVERERVEQFITDRGGTLSDFAVQIALVAAHSKGKTDRARGLTRVVPSDIAGAVALADELQKDKDLLYVGILAAVMDKGTGFVVRWMRPFVVSIEATEILAWAALDQMDKQKKYGGSE